MTTSSEIIISTLIFTWLSIITILFLIIVAKYRRLTKNLDQKDLLSLLEKITREAGFEKKQLRLIKESLLKMEKDSLLHLQKVGFVRFNPFAQTGGNQSFCLALLDGQENGLVLSSLHSRGSTRIYAKPVKKGQEAGFQFSKEELQAIKKAQS